MSNLQRIICGIGVFSSLQLIFGIYIAIQFYPGGFNIFEYPIGNLLAQISMNGHSNIFSALIFLLSLLIFVVFTLPIWLVIPIKFTESMVETGLSTLGSVFGIMGSVIIIQAILSFINETEYNYTSFFSLFFVLSFFLYSLAIMFNPKISNYYSLSGFFMIIFFILLNNLQIAIPIVDMIFIIWVLLNENVLISCVWPLLIPNEQFDQRRTRI